MFRSGGWGGSTSEQLILIKSLRPCGWRLLRSTAPQQQWLHESSPSDKAMPPSPPLDWNLVLRAQSPCRIIPNHWIGSHRHRRFPLQLRALRQSPAVRWFVNSMRPFQLDSAANAHRTRLCSGTTRRPVCGRLLCCSAVDSACPRSGFKLRPVGPSCC
eukprot:COSAG02_NODE_7_length_64539_cov_120.393482_38_plen_158_part_00